MSPADGRPPLGLRPGLAPPGDARRVMPGVRRLGKSSDPWRPCHPELAWVWGRSRPPPRLGGRFDRERAIDLHEALDRSDPREQEAYLAPGVRRRRPAAGAGSRPCSARTGRTVGSSWTGLFAADLAATGDLPTHAERPGTLIGPYKLLQQIGEGGMGTVFMAEQTAPVRRMVALKVIKPGMDTRQVHRPLRGRAAGPGPDGPPQHRQGPRRRHDRRRAAPTSSWSWSRASRSPTTATSDRLTPRERLELFVPVCQAVQHAHQKGIIHRDLKPSNVLVALYDGRPVPKVIDFGVAKATGPQLTERTLFTEFGAVVGTLEYMSPEQAELNQLDVDTRSDIYSLGVLLYELLTGTTPLEPKRLQEAALAGSPADHPRGGAAAAEHAAEHDRGAAVDRGQPRAGAEAAQRPGARRAGLDRDEGAGEGPQPPLRDGQRPGGGPAALPGRRAGAGLPAVAAVSVRKFARRHRVAVITSALVATALVLGLAASLWQARSTRQALDRERLISYFQRIALADREWSANNLSRAVQLLDQCPPDLRGWEWNYLRRLRGKSLAPLRHDAAVLCAAISPDGESIAASDQDGMIRIWDARTGQQLRSFRAHAKHARSIAFSPDGLRLASGGWDGTVKVWDAQTGGLMAQREGPGGRIARVAFSPDGKRLAVGSSTGGGPGMTGADGPGVLQIWDATLGEPLRTIRGHDGIIRMAFSPDGRRLATVSDDKEVKLWDAVAAKHLPRYLGAFAWRFNRRFVLKTIYERMAIAAAATPPMPYRLLKLAEARW